MTSVCTLLRGWNVGFWMHSSAVHMHRLFYATQIHTAASKWLICTKKSFISASNSVTLGCFFSLNFSFFLFYVYKYFTYMYECTPCVCLIPEIRRRHWIPWNWNYRQLWAIMWVLGIEPRSSVWAPSPSFLSFLGGTLNISKIECTSINSILSDI